MKRLIWIIFLIIISGCALLTTANKNPVIVPLYPESEVPPIIRTTINKNVNILRDCHRIAIVGITRHSIPTLSEKVIEAQDILVKMEFERELKKVKVWAESDSLAYPHYSKMDSILGSYSDSLNFSTVRMIESHDLKSQQMLNSIIYESYESQFLTYGFDVVERNRIDMVLEELNLSDLGLIEEKEAINAGQMLAAQAVCLIEIYSIVGEYYKPQNPKISDYGETFKVIIVETGQIAFTGTAKNVVGGRELMFYEIAGKILAQYEPLIE